MHHDAEERDGGNEDRGNDRDDPRQDRIGRAQAPQTLQETQPKAFPALVALLQANHLTRSAGRLELFDMRENDDRFMRREEVVRWNVRLAAQCDDAPAQTGLRFR